MSEQIGLFDVRAAESRRQAGIAKAAASSEGWIDRARGHARRIAVVRGVVTADDVRAAMYPHDQPEHSNAWGSVFRGRGWVWTGDFRKSEVPQGHGNLQRVWRLR